MPDEELTPIGAAGGEALALRLLTGTDLDRYLQLKQELRDAMNEIKERCKRTLRRLRKARLTKPEQFAEARHFHADQRLVGARRNAAGLLRR